MKKRLFLSFLCMCFILTLSFVRKIDQTPAKTQIVSSSLESKPIIIIDCGHGGEDGGAVSQSGLLEKDINLEIGLILEKLFLQSGFDVYMIRSTDKAIYDNNAESLREKKVSDIHNRSKIANSDQRNILISIHQNQFEDSKYSGAQVFYSKNTESSKILAENIRLAIKGLIQSDNERQCKAADSNIYILDKSNVPAVLVECGFLSNVKEAERLSDLYYREQISFAIFAGFLEFYYNNY